MTVCRSLRPLEGSASSRVVGGPASCGLLNGAEDTSTKVEKPLPRLRTQDIRELVLACCLYGDDATLAQLPEWERSVIEKLLNRVEHNSNSTRKNSDKESGVDTKVSTAGDEENKKESVSAIFTTENSKASSKQRGKSAELELVQNYYARNVFGRSEYLHRLTELVGRVLHENPTEFLHSDKAELRVPTKPTSTTPTIAGVQVRGATGAANNISKDERETSITAHQDTCSTSTDHQETSTSASGVLDSNINTASTSSQDKSSSPCGTGGAHSTPDSRVGLLRRKHLALGRAVSPAVLEELIQTSRSTQLLSHKLPKDSSRHSNESGSAAERPDFSLLSLAGKALYGCVATILSFFAPGPG
ncbi:unnamed protein product, partial [Amoebophrya sp. A25]|eukprot:GSA25T00011167001.1